MCVQCYICSPSLYFPLASYPPLQSPLPCLFPSPYLFPPPSSLLHSYCHSIIQLLTTVIPLPYLHLLNPSSPPTSLLPSSFPPPSTPLLPSSPPPLLLPSYPLLPSSSPPPPLLPPSSPPPPLLPRFMVRTGWYAVQPSSRSCVFVLEDWWPCGSVLASVMGKHFHLMPTMRITSI